MSQAALCKYLELYAEPQLTEIPDLPPDTLWHNTMVIPACNESPDFLRAPPDCPGRSLLILVINQSAEAAASVSRANRLLSETVETRFSLSGAKQNTESIRLFTDPRHERDILLVDCFSAGRELPAKGGVGLARKIGADIAASLYRDGLIKSPWIHCTDGDVEWPETYFSACQHLEKDLDTAALVYPFLHCRPGNDEADGSVHDATRLYEFSLHYYVSALAFAGSPYAFHTIGSTMAIHALHYARVRGFPKREAGEDFYLLNKLAKSGAVVELPQSEDCKPIRIRSRRSDRVPFGTGAAVNTILERDDPYTEFKFYNPGIFNLLREWLALWPGIYASGSAELDDNLMDRTSLPGNERALLLSALQQIQAQKGLAHALGNSKSLQQFNLQMNHWFDAFRTLKLVHALRDSGFASMPYPELQKAESFQALVQKDTNLAHKDLALRTVYPM